MWFDHRETAAGHEPQSTVARPNAVAVSSLHRKSGEAVCRVVRSETHLIAGIGRRRVKLRSRQSNNAGARRQPEIVLIVFGHPVDTAGRKAVSARDYGEPI